MSIRIVITDAPSLYQNRKIEKSRFIVFPKNILPLHIGGVIMKYLSLLTLIFAILFAVFFLGLIFFRIPFPLYPLMSYQDVFDLLTPLVLIPIYWLMLKYSTGESSRAVQIAFMIIAALWVLGHGMHLAANSVNNLTEKLAEQDTLNILKTDIYKLTYFYDEELSHYLWHAGILGMVVLLAYNEYRHPANLSAKWGVTAVSGILYGFSAFCIHVEGQTAVPGYAFAVIFVLLVLIFARKKLSAHPLLAFFFVSYLITAILFTIWLAIWGGLPEISEVGWI
jgi:hypothetical protein